MWKRFVAGAFMLLVLAGCGSGPKEYAWQSIDTTVDVQQDGTLHVTEELTLRYIQGTFSFVERDLPYRSLDSITDIRVSTDGREMAERSGGEPYTFTVERVDDVERVHAVYPASSNGTRTITLRYTVGGAVRRDSFSSYDGQSGQQIWWSMVFPQRDGAVERATGRIILPAAFPQGQLEADTPDAYGSVEIGASDVSVLATNVPAGEELSLRVRFPAVVDNVHFYTSVTAANAAPQSKPDSGFDPNMVPGVLFIVVVGGWFLWNIIRWMKGEDVQWDAPRRNSHSYHSSSSHDSSSSSDHSSGGGGGHAG